MKSPFANLPQNVRCSPTLVVQVASLRNPNEEGLPWHGFDATPRQSSFAQHIADTAPGRAGPDHRHIEGPIFADRHLGARIVITSVLHTWGSALTHHVHMIGRMFIIETFARSWQPKH